jgi:hypothetical protein
MGSFGPILDAVGEHYVAEVLVTSLPSGRNVAWRRRRDGWA